MPKEELKQLLKEAMAELAQEGHHTCLVFKTPESQQIAKDIVRIGVLAKTGIMVAVAFAILGGTALALWNRLFGALK